MNNYEFVEAVLQLSYEVDMKEDGRPVYKTKVYRPLKSQVSATAVAAVATSIASLTTYPLAAISTTHTNDVVAV